MAKKMLIDATHDEEVRVAIVDGNRLEEFDSETSTKRQIRGNIYLAKVIRIEPSLQAAFVEFGGNRHGFLPFGEIHPDYFRIPVSDRPLIESETKPSEIENLPEGKSFQKKPKKGKGSQTPTIEETSGLLEERSDFATIDDDTHEPIIDLLDEDEIPRRPRIYHYKIQEVIKRRQIMLIQVVKEERGNKGAALTTYLSLPGRYCVLMPNAGHRGGGISRKISDGGDRRRLRDILKDLEIPEGMSLIVRTAGQERNKLEIRRDFDYLVRLWEEIREATLKAIAPALIYAEDDLIKRSIRDIYNRDIDQILIEGNEAYKAAKAFMKALIPSHTKRVQPYKDSVPLFHRHKVEEQIDAMMNPTAKLPSGGSIVINPTEALVAIDVNSGKSTRERHIDKTALNTNLEAADEIARQIRLRDLAGLVVIDFIDMSEQKHTQAVEKRLKDATSRDRARIQLGHISQFGLLELSRQRLRPSLIEANSSPCQHCRGTGFIRSVESMSLLVLRAIEKEGIEGRSAEIVATVPTGVDLYLLNQKRTTLAAIENRYQMQVIIRRDDMLVSPDFRIECLVDRKSPVNLPILPPVGALDTVQEKEKDLQPSLKEESPPVEKVAAHGASQNEGGGRRRRHRRPFSKRRDQERHLEHIPDEHAHKGQEDKEKSSARIVSIEEQIVNEVFGPSQNAKEISSNRSSPAKEKLKEERETGQENYHHSRRRRHGRHNNQRQSQAEKRENLSSSLEKPMATPLDRERKSAALAQVKKPSLTSPAKDIVVPITALPEGLESSLKKNSHGRWWKRLLES